MTQRRPRQDRVRAPGLVCALGSWLCVAALVASSGSTAQSQTIEEGEGSAEIEPEAPATSDDDGATPDEGGDSPHSGEDPGRGDLDRDEPGDRDIAEPGEPPSSQRPDELTIKVVFRAIACYSNLNYECVIEVLAPFPRWYQPPSPGATPPGVVAGQVGFVVESGRYLAISYLAIGQEARAREVFRWLLDVDPSFVLGGSEVAPSFLAIFFDVRASYKGLRRGEDALAAARRVRSQISGFDVGEQITARAEAFEPPYEPPPPPELDVALRAGTHLVLLAGADRDVFSDALAFDFEVDFSFDTRRWLFGVALAFSEHDVLLDNLVFEQQTSLTVFHASGRGGYEFRFGALGLRPEVSLGLTTLGVTDSINRLGLNGALGGVMSVYLGPQVIVATSVRSRTVGLWADGLQLSTTTELGLQAGARF